MFRHMASPVFRSLILSFLGLAFAGLAVGLPVASVAIRSGLPPYAGTAIGLVGAICARRMFD